MTTLQAGIGLSKERDPILAAHEAAKQAKFNLHREKVDLALVFSSWDLSRASVSKTINQYIGGAPIIGCSSNAVISSQGIAKHGLVIMVLSLPEEIYFNTACVKDIDKKSPLIAGQELAEKLLYGAREIRRDLSIIFSDRLIKGGSGLIHGLQKELGSSFPLIGASASDNLTFSKTYLHSNEGVFNNGACGILLGGRLNFGLGIKHGWQPLGKPRHVTKSSGNIVYEIDGAVATKLYEEYFAYSLTNLRNELKRISVLYPIGIYLPGEKEYLLRNILSIQDDGSLIFQGEVPENSTIRLMIGTKESCLSATKEALNEAKSRIAGHDIRFVMVFDSISRYILLGRDAHREIDIIKDGLHKDTPVIGFYTYGEQAPLTAVDYRGKSYFHNQTITVLAIG